MLKKNGALAALCLVALIVGLAAAAPWISPDPDRGDLDKVLRPPSPSHWMGTDGNGRDVWSRVIHGARVSLTVGFCAAGLSLLVGLPVGAIAGYRGGWTDAAVARGVEAAMCFPAIVVTIALLSIDPPWMRALPETLRISVALAVVGWTPAARYLRAEVRKLRSSDAIASARAAGAGHARIVWKHLVPRGLAPVLATLAFAIGSASLAEATLSFVGVGVAPPTASWGEMLYEAQAAVGTAWWLAVFPGAALFLLVLGCNEIADAIRETLDRGRSGA